MAQRYQHQRHQGQVYQHKIPVSLLRHVREIHHDSRRVPCEYQSLRCLRVSYDLGSHDMISAVHVEGQINKNVKLTIKLGRDLHKVITDLIS